MAKAMVDASGFIAAQIRAASLVQALIEAETAAARLGGIKATNKSEAGDEERVIQSAVWMKLDENGWSDVPKANFGDGAQQCDV